MGEDDRESVQDAAADRKGERAETVEEILATVRDDLGDHTYPVSSEELSAHYANAPRDLTNETEWIGSAFDRIEQSFEDEQEAYEALVTEFERGQHLGDRSDAVGDEPSNWDGDRAAAQEPLGKDEGSEMADEIGYRESEADARRRARQAQTADDSPDDARDGDAPDDAGDDESEG